MMQDALSKLQESISHRFAAVALLEQALTHSSYANEQGRGHNERLEFLGDAVLELTVSQELYERFPEAPEGVLTKLRAKLVSMPSLAGIARRLNLEACVFLGRGEESQGGRERDSLLSDALEAVFGAVWLDGGFDASSRVIAHLYDGMLSEIGSGKPIKDAKTRLQEFLQGRRLPLPKYVLTAIEGEAHAQSFNVVCEIANLQLKTSGQGASRRAAEQMAAENALEKLNVNE